MQYLGTDLPISFEVDEKSKEDFLSASRYIKDLSIHQLNPDFTGIRPKLQAPDDSLRDFIILNECEKGLENFINLIGIESPGLTSSLAIGKYVESIIGTFEFSVIFLITDYLEIKNMKNTLDLIVYDFDGVMTNDYAYIDNKGNDCPGKQKRRFGCFSNKKINIKQIIMSSEHNKVVTSRAEKLNVKCIQGIKNKKDTLSKYCVENNFDLEKVGLLAMT